MEAETDIVLETGEELATEAAPAQRHALPFSFAKRHGVLIRELGTGGGKAVYRSGASPMSLAEVRRFAGVPLEMSRVSAEAFDTPEGSVEVPDLTGLTAKQAWKQARDRGLKVRVFDRGRGVHWYALEEYAVSKQITPIGSHVPEGSAVRLVAKYDESMFASGY